MISTRPRRSDQGQNLGVAQLGERVHITAASQQIVSGLQAPGLWSTVMAPIMFLPSSLGPVVLLHSIVREGSMQVEWKTGARYLQCAEILWITQVNRVNPGLPKLMQALALQDFQIGFCSLPTSALV